MKKLTLLLVILIILSMSSLAVEVNTKEVYLSGQTLQAEINLTESLTESLTPLNIFIIDPNNNELKIGSIIQEIFPNYYYLYLNLPTTLTSGTYNLQIKDMTYENNNILLDLESKTPFEVNINESVPTISISPAFLILTNQESFEIKIKNSEDKDVEIQASSKDDFIYPIRPTITALKNSETPLRIKTNLELISEELNSEIVLAYSNQEYTIPIFIIREEQEIPENITKENKTEEPSEPTFPFSLIPEINKINQVLDNQTTLKGELEIKNNLAKYLNNIQLTTDLNILTIQPSTIEAIPPNKTKIVTILINPEKNALPNNYNGKIVINYEGFSKEIDLDLTIIKATEEQKQENVTITNLETPNDDIKKIYNITEPPEPKKSNTGFLIFIVITLIAIILIIIFKKILKPTTQKKEFESILKNHKV